MGDVILWVYLIGVPVVGLGSIVPWYRHMEADCGPAETYEEFCLGTVTAALYGVMTGALWPLAIVWVFGYVQWWQKYDYNDDHIGTVRMRK